MKHMRFIRTDSPELVAGFMAGMLQAYLNEGKRVLWLLSGGSGIATAVAAWKLLEVGGSQLIIGQIDERYGVVGHQDSNWHQLEQAGLAVRPGEQALPILVGKPIEETVAAYGKRLAGELDRADVCVGFLGMGSDGHTAGVLPHSPALGSSELVASYQAEDYQRITITAEVIKRLDVALLLANGEAKKAQLERLKGEAPAVEQPAQLLKQAAQVVVFSDAVAV